MFLSLLKNSCLGQVRSWMAKPKAHSQMFGLVPSWMASMYFLCTGGFELFVKQFLSCNESSTSCQCLRRFECVRTCRECLCSLSCARGLRFFRECQAWFFEKCSVSWCVCIIAFFIDGWHRLISSQAFPILPTGYIFGCNPVVLFVFLFRKQVYHQPPNVLRFRCGIEWFNSVQSLVSTEASTSSWMLVQFLLCIKASTSS